MNKKQISIMFISLLSITAIYLLSSIIVHANIIEKHKKTIENNTYRIEQIEDIKSHLHKTAELIRRESIVNNDFDILLSQKWHEYNNEKIIIEAENAALDNKIKEMQNKREFIGDFKITHYCPCSTCNGSWGNKAAIGTVVTPYKTIAVDPKIIPLGSKVEILGDIYTAEDTGGAIKGKKIDICVNSHSEAYQRGVLKNIPVYIIKE